jgi:protein phosphatase
MAARDGGHVGNAGAVPDLAARDGGHVGNTRPESLLHSGHVPHPCGPGAAHGLAAPAGQTPAPLRWVSGAATDQGMIRSINQDAYLDRPDLGLWAVADGMGGHTDGALASRTIVAGLGRLRHPRRLGSAARAIRAILRAVNQGLLDQAATLPAGGIIGSTAVVLLAVGGHCAVLWVGDSRAYRLRDGALTQLTTDHSQVQALIDADLLSPERAAGHSLSNVLLRAVGSEAHLEVDGRIERVKAGDRYLLCSDGLFRELDVATIVATLGPSPPTEGAKALVEQACAMGGRDNVTAVVIDCLASMDFGHQVPV